MFDNIAAKLRSDLVFAHAPVDALCCIRPEGDGRQNLRASFGVKTGSFRRAPAGRRGRRIRPRTGCIGETVSSPLEMKG